METPFQKMHDENMKFVVETCAHGNSHHCQSCEIKYLKYVIEEQQKAIAEWKEGIVYQGEKVERYEKTIRNSMNYLSDKCGTVAEPRRMTIGEMTELFDMLFDAIRAKD